MKRVVQCPNGHRFRCDESLLGKSVRCPHKECNEKFRLIALDDPGDLQAPKEPKCSQCGTELALGAAICVQCGTHVSSGQRFDTRIEPPAEDTEATPSFTELIHGHRVKRMQQEDAEERKQVAIEGVKFIAFAFFAVVLAQLNIEGHRPRLVPSFAWPFVSEHWKIIWYVIAGLSVLAVFATLLPEPNPDKQVESRSRLESLRSRLAVRHQPESDPVTVEAIIDQLQSKHTTSRTWRRFATVLLLSLGLFLAAGLLRFDLATLAVLSLVIFVHECGHLGAMKLYGFRDISMFFIPLFGAGVTGKNDSATATQRAIVALAGPIPSLLLALALVPVYAAHASPWLGTAIAMMVLLNGLNLAPVFPLDGGRFLNEVLFSRHPVLEAAFRIIAALALLLVGFLMADWVLAAFGALLLLGMHHFIRLSRITRDVRASTPLEQRVHSASLDPSVIETILRAVRRRAPRATSLSDTEFIVRDVLLRLKAQPPRWTTSLALIALYVVAVACVLATPIAYALLVLNGVLPEPSSGAALAFIEGFREGLEGPAH